MVRMHTFACTIRNAHTRTLTLSTTDRLPGGLSSDVVVLPPDDWVVPVGVLPGLGVVTTEENDSSLPKLTFSCLRSQQQA